MKKNNISLIQGITLSLSSLLIGGWLALHFFSADHDKTMAAANETKQPKYWVAPMDANFRRDKPGLSPMGMDLVPVYENENTAGEGPGTVKINPSVVNNIGVRTEKVQLAPLETEIKTVGYVNYNQDRLVHIHPRVSGWVEKLNINSVGDTVEKGQAIYSLYSPELVNAQEEFVLALNRKNTRLIKAAKNRLLALNIPNSAITALQESHKVQQQVTFYAPQSGVVENLSIREGFYVQPGTMLFSIGDLTEVWVEAEVLERQAGFVFLNDQVSMTLDFVPGKDWQGTVDYIYPTLDSQTRTMKVRLRFDNKNLALKPNMFTQVIIHGKPTENTIVIAKEALIRTGTQDRVVLALGEGQFKSIAVDVGRSDGKKIEILSGLSSDDTIVTSAQFLLDSESSKTSDFKRMSAMDMDMDMDMDMENVAQPVAQAQVSGTINSIDVSNRIVNISRGPIEKWQRPAATLDFYVASNITLSQFSEGMEINFTFAIENGEFTVITIHPNASEMH
ncbi:MAG: efflux RND transporter periplasmic adaptor subunit [Cognaticolwellia sp.]